MRPRAGVSITVILSILSLAAPLDAAATPVFHITNFNFNPSSSLVSRISAAPQSLLVELVPPLSNSGGFPHTPSKKEMKVIEKAMGRLPSYILKTLRERLAGIYFISNLPADGITVWITGTNALVYAFAAFNPACLNQNISAWLSSIENSRFIPSKGWSVTVDCGTAESGFLYSLLREGARIADGVSNFTPYPDHAMMELMKTMNRNPRATAFVQDTWLAFDIPEPQNDFTGRTALKPKTAESPAIYDALSRSPFLSLRASENWGDDWADAAAYYHLAARLGLPYRISVISNGRTVRRYQPMKFEKVPPRLAFIQSLYPK